MSEIVGNQRNVFEECFLRCYVMIKIKSYCRGGEYYGMASMFQAHRKTEQCIPLHMVVKFVFMHPVARRVTHSGLLYSDQTLPQIPDDDVAVLVHQLSQLLGRLGTKCSLEYELQGLIQPVTEIDFVFRLEEADVLVQKLQTITLFDTHEMITDVNNFLTQ